jgi:hypothetical protein
MKPSWEAASCPGTQEFPNISWNPKVHYNPPLGQINPAHTTPSSLTSILILSTHSRFGLPGGLFLSGIPLRYVSATCIAHRTLPWLDHSSYTWRRVQVKMLLIMQFSPISRHLISLRSKYSPQHPVLKHLLSMFLPYSKRPSFTPIQNQRQNYSFLYFIYFLYIFILWIYHTHIKVTHSANVIIHVSE